MSTPKPGSTRARTPLLRLVLRRLLRPAPRSVARRAGAVVIAVCLAAGAITASLVSTAGATASGDLLSAAAYTSAMYGPRGAQLPFAGSEQPACAAPRSDAATCLIHVLAPAGTTPGARPATVTTPTGLSPSAIKSVYGYTTSPTAGSGQTIAVVDAYGDPDANGDLSTFSAQYGLPPECTGSATPPSCFDFSVVNQTGGASLPATNSSWDLEISLDIEWAHAIAPGASILLVEANSSTLSNLLAAEQYAAAHADDVSNSWGSTEFSSEASDDSYFTRPGVSYFAAAGDSAAELLWPSVSPDVVSVGGTSLAFTAGGSLAQETAWSDSGGGCSRYETASASQTTGSVSCAGKRATPDVALDADPNSGMSVYDSVAYENQSGWWTVGGTSASTVMVAAQAAVDGADVNAPYVYALPADVPFRDITAGSNGHSALPGYDLVTGLGSWSYTPGEPTALTATSGTAGVTLRWSAPTGAAVSAYNIWRGTASGQETVEVATVPAAPTSYVDTSATGAVTYYYEIQPVNTSGVGPFSAQALATPPSVPPVASFKKACSQASCTFTSTSTDAQGTISSYSWNGGNGVLGSGSTFSDAYSTAGTDTVSLTVTNTAGQSSAAATATVTCVSSSGGFVGFGGGRGRQTLACS